MDADRQGDRAVRHRAADRPLVLLYERKLLGRLQNRYGPNRVGPFGLAQPLADILKLLTKEQFRPRTSTGFLFVLAPVLSIVTAAATFAIIPFGDTVDIFGTKTGLYGVDVSIGPLFLFAFGAIAFYGIMLGGYASGSKYSFLGSMRAAAQLISYEAPRAWRSWGSSSPWARCRWSTSWSTRPACGSSCPSSSAS